MICYIAIDYYFDGECQIYKHDEYIYIPHVYNVTLRKFCSKLT